MMQIREINDLGSLESLKPSWKELAERVADDFPYLTPEFMLPWVRRIRDRFICRALAAWDGGRLIGLAPVFDRSIRKWGIRFTVRSFPVSGPSPPFDILIAEGRGDEVMAAFAEHWLRAADWDLIDLENVRSESPTATLLGRAFEGTSVRFDVREAMRTSFVPVTTTWEAFLSSRSKNFRHNLRRSKKRCDSAGGVHILHYPGDGLSIDRAVEMAFQVIGNSWKDHDEGPTGWNHFILELIWELEKSRMLSLRFLLLGGTPVAYQLEIEYRRNLHGVHNAYDLAHQADSPGHLLLADGLRAAHEGGYGRFDFLGTKDYLLHWTKEFRSFNRIRLMNGSLAARIKTPLYDWEHERRERKGRERTEAAKEAKKDARRPGPKQTGDETR